MPQSLLGTQHVKKARELYTDKKKRSRKKHQLQEHEGN